MTPENRARVYAAAPVLFLSGPPYCGFCCGDGWTDLLVRLVTRLEALILPGDPLPTPAQIKEKFGSLRFYLDGATDEMEAAIGDAERESARTCERCGAPGEIVSRRCWLRARCRLCDAEDGE